MRILAACVDEYFYGQVDFSGDVKSSEDPIYKGYKAVLDSKTTDETLVSYVSSRYCHKFLILQISYCSNVSVLNYAGITC